MRRIVVVLIALFFVQSFANPLVFLSQRETCISLEWERSQFKISLFQPLVHPVVPIDWLLPRQNRDLLKGLVSVESDFYIHALSSEGAMGLTQLLPSTAKELGVLNPFNAFYAIDGANRYLEQLQRQFKKVEYALAAYFEGPVKVAKYGPSNTALSYARKVLRSSEQLKDETVFVKDVTYVEPYISVGEKFALGLNVYVSLLGTSYLSGGIQLDDWKKLSHQVLFYPAVTHSLSLIVGEKNFNFTVGALYRKMPDFGVQLLIDSKSFDFSTLLRVWKFYINTAYSSEGFRVGLMISM
ncbi:lytic transglycosylase domain-containing protein [Pseudothermotoga sp.]|uniref:lytic transglycosylase domain-containing protein n=1 Tax=Pseudothermotoga sp. TaxID=2033661 RepID=UPI0031F65F20